MVATSKSLQEQSNELTSQPTGAQKWLVLLGIGAGAFMIGIEFYVVGVVLPTLVTSFDTNFAITEWVMLSYFLIITVMVLSVGWLGDMYNKKWLYLGGLILFTFSSLLCGLASTVELLIGFRVLQGLGAVFMTGLRTAIITQVFSQEERGRALGIVNAIGTLGVAIGPGLGGLLMSVGGWRLTFLVNVPLGIVAIFIVAFALPSLASSKISQSFDLVGAGLMTLTLTCFALLMTRIQTFGFGESIELILLVVAAIGLVCFLIVESRLKEPMLDIGIFRLADFSLNLLLLGMMFAVVAGMQLLLPVFLAVGKHYPPQEIGLLLTVLPLAAALVSPIAGTLSDRFGSRPVSMIGLLLMGLGCWGASGLNAESTVLGFLIRTVPLELGLGVFVAPNSDTIMSCVPQERIGIASGLWSLSRTLGMLSGVALLGTLFTMVTISDTKFKHQLDVTTAPVEALVKGVDTTFAVMGLIVLTSAILGIVLWWRSRSTSAESNAEIAN